MDLRSKISPLARRFRRLPVVLQRRGGRPAWLATLALSGLVGAPGLMALAPEDGHRMAALPVPSLADHTFPVANPRKLPVRFTVINATATSSQTSATGDVTEDDVSDPDMGNDAEPMEVTRSFRFRPGKGVRFRTWCVRLCDGYYFPMNYLTTRDKLRQDEMKCAASCPGGSRLYVNAIVGYKARPLTDLSGNPYSSLPTAFAYRTRLDPSCSCAAAPARQELAADPAQTEALPSRQEYLSTAATGSSGVDE